MNCQLKPHSTDSHGLTITAEAEREGTELLLRFEVSGAVDRLLIRPTANQPQRRDELWRHTCFEAFIRPARSGAYHELNLAPSGDWAFYHFDSWRCGMNSPHVTAPAIEFTSAPALLTLRASIDLATLLSPAVPWQLNLTAVLEDEAGGTSYWALAHPRGGPDFHHPDCFVLELTPPAGT